MISRLTRDRTADLTSCGESLQRELRDQDDDSEEDEELSDEYNDVSCTGASDTQDSHTDNGGEEKRTKKTRINSVLREQIKRELCGPGKFADPVLRKQEKGKRYSVAVASPSGEQHVVELGTSVQATVARNMTSDVFTHNATKDSGEMLEMLRERKKSRDNLMKAHTLAESFQNDEPGFSSASAGEITSEDILESPLETEELASPPKMDRSLPILRLHGNDEEDDDEEEEDVISKLVGKTSLLSPPFKSSRKVSLQEELCGKGPQVGLV